MSYQCFFDKFTPAMTRFCEDPVYCFIKHPAETWTNIGPILAGLFILAFAKHGSKVALLGWAAIVTGVFSVLFHASGTFLGEILDIAGMFLFISTCMGLTLSRRGMIDEKKILAVALAGFAVGITVSYLNIYFSMPLFGLIAATTLLIEFTNPQKYNYHYMKIAIGFFLVSFLAWSLDFWRIVCDPANHFINGHGVWHLLSGFTFFYIFKYYQLGAKE